jgi:2-polyprenyl-3-methyl-5-hydroxy-6-metoxy-1,4-benzoquinol methylase
VNSTSGSTDPKRVVERGYDQVAHDYARLEGESEWPRMRWLRKLLNRLEPGSSVLDLGCGSGEPADVEIAKEHQVTGVDISQTQINLARQNVPTGHFLSCYDPDTMKQMVNEAGFELLETAIETQLEGGNDIPFLWLLGQKR